MADYYEVFALLSAWSSVPFTTAFQSDFFSQPNMPLILNHVASHHASLGRQLSPRHGAVALRAACPVPGCALAEKHGRLNTYHFDDTSTTTPACKITFHCPPPRPAHGRPLLVRGRRPARGQRADPQPDPQHEAPARPGHAPRPRDGRRLRRHVPGGLPAPAPGRLVGRDGARGGGRTPHILHAPLVVDWSGAKLSKSLYVREGGYAVMELLGTDGLCSYDVMRRRYGPQGLRRLWDEVGRWLADPRRLFRT